MKPPRRRTRFAVVAVVAALAVGAIGAFVLMARACQPRAEQADPQLKLGDAMLGRAKPEKAIAAYQKALATPARDEALLRLAAVYETAGDFRQAEIHLKQAREKAPQDVALRLSLARVVAATGRVREGYAEAKHAADAAPDSAEALAMLATLATTKDEAAHAAEKLRAWNTFHGKKPSEEQQPATETLIPLMHAYELLGDHEKAERAQSEAKRVGVRDLNLALNLANVCFSMEHLVPAELLLIAATEHSPKRAATWLRLAAVEAGLRKWAGAGDALAHLDKTLKAHPETVLIDARVRLGLGKPAEASKSLTALLTGPLSEGPKTMVSRAHFWRAQAALAQHDNKSAEADLKASILADAEFITAELALADLYLSAGSAELAKARLTALAARKPLAHQVFRLLGRAQLELNNAKGAEQAWKRVSELQPDDPEGPYLEATALEAQGRFDEAEKRLETSLALRPGAFTPLRRLVVLMGRAGKFSEAENRIHIELARKGRSARLLTLLGDVLFEERTKDPAKIGEAEKAYREAVAEMPSESAAWSALGRLYALTGSPDRAILMYGEAIKHEPNLPEAWMHVGQLYMERGDALKAEQALREVVSRRPDFAPALNNLAYLYAELMGKPDKALEYAARAHKAAPGSASIADTYGWALFQTGKTAEALPVLTQAAQALPKSADAQFHLGMALLRSARPEEGRAALTRALTLSGTFAGAKAARAALAGP